MHKLVSVLILKKTDKGGSCPSFHCLLKNTKIEWNMKSHIFYKGSSELRGEKPNIFFLEIYLQTKLKFDTRL